MLGSLPPYSNKGLIKILQINTMSLEEKNKKLRQENLNLDNF